MARPSAAVLLIALALAAAGCNSEPEPTAHAGQGPAASGPSARERFANALIATRRAGSAAVTEHLVSEPARLERTITGRTRFDRNEALLDVVYHQHPALTPGTRFRVLIDFASYVRRANGRWYVPPFGSPDFELGYADLMHLIGRAYGRVDSQGPGAFLVWMSRANLERMRTSGEGVGPLWTLYGITGPMRFVLDDAGRIARMEYQESGTYLRYLGLGSGDSVSVDVGFRGYRSRFGVDPPPGDAITSGPLTP